MLRETGLSLLRNPFVIGLVGIGLTILPIALMLASTSYDDVDMRVRGLPMQGTFTGVVDNSTTPSNISGHFEGFVGSGEIKYFNGSVYGTVQIHSSNDSELSGWLTGEIIGRWIRIDLRYLNTMIICFIVLSVAFSFYASRLNHTDLNHFFAVILAFAFSITMGSDLIWLSWSLVRSDVVFQKSSYLLGYLVIFLLSWSFFLLIPYVIDRFLKRKRGVEFITIFEKWILRIAVLLGILVYLIGASQLIGENLQFLGFGATLYGRLFCFISTFIGVSIMLHLAFSIFDEYYEANISPELSSLDYHRQITLRKKASTLLLKESSRLFLILFLLGAGLLAIYSFSSEDIAGLVFVLIVPTVSFVVLLYAMFRITKIHLAVGLLDPARLRKRKFLNEELRGNLIPFLEVTSFVIVVVILAILVLHVSSWNIQLGPVNRQWPSFTVAGNPAFPLLLTVLLQAFLLTGFYTFAVPYLLHRGKRKVLFGILGFFLSLLIYECIALLTDNLLVPLGMVYFVEVPILGSILNSAMVYVLEHKKDKLIERIESKEIEIGRLMKEIEEIRKHLLKDSKHG